MIRFLPVVVIGSRSLAYQEAADAASQAREGLPLRTLALTQPPPRNDLLELFISSRCAAIYASHSAICRSVSTKCLRSSSVTALFPNPPSASASPQAPPDFLDLTQSRERLEGRRECYVNPRSEAGAW